MKKIVRSSLEKISLLQIQEDILHFLGSGFIKQQILPESITRKMNSQRSSSSSRPSLVTRSTVELEPLQYESER